MEDIHKHLIDMIIEEKLDTSNIFPIEANAKQEIVQTLLPTTTKTTTQETSTKDFSSINEQKFTYYLQQRIPPTKQTYHPELSIMLDDLQEYEDNLEYEALYRIAKHIFKEHKDILSFANASKIFLILADYDIRHGEYESAFVFLSSIKTYEKYLSSEHKIFLTYLLTPCLYHLGSKNNNTHYFNKAIEYSHYIINHIHDKDSIKTALIIQINSAYILKDFELCLLAIEEYFRTFPLSKDDNISVQTLFLQGLVYEERGDNAHAIETFKKYLQIHPNDQEAKMKIRLLSEKEGE